MNAFELSNDDENEDDLTLLVLLVAFSTLSGGLKFQRLLLLIPSVHLISIKYSAFSDQMN
jgi:hypothetical protein